MAVRRLHGATLVPYWLLAVLLLGMIGTTGLLVYATTREPVPAPVAIAVEAHTLAQAPVSGSDAAVIEAAAAAEAARLREQLAALVADLEQAERDGSVLFHLSQEQSAELSDTQAALSAAEQAREQVVRDLESRIAALEEQIDAVEQLAARMRRLVGLPEGDGPAGGPSVPTDLPTDPAEAAWARINHSLQRVEALQSTLDEIGQRAQARLLAVERSGALTGGIPPSALAFSPDVPRGRPVAGPITSTFGPRENPFGEGGTEVHTGVDLAAPEGTTVLATGGGVVRMAGWSGAYGNLVVIDHGNGISTYYGHNSVLLVSQGQRVEPGQAVALAGNTGRSTGAHVHYEVRINGVPVDPTPYINLGS